MFKHYVRVEAGGRFPENCECGCDRTMMVTTRNDAGALHQAYYCPVCILRDVDTWRERLNERTRERDEARGDLDTHKHSNKLLQELAEQFKRERDSLMGANAIWEENRKRWNRERDALQSRVKELQQTLATAQIECNDARRQIDVMKGKASPVNHPSASVVPVQTDAQTEQYAEGFAAGRADGRRATYGDGFKEGRASAFEQISDYIRNAWRKG